MGLGPRLGGARLGLGLRVRSGLGVLGPALQLWAVAFVAVVVTEEAAAGPLVESQEARLLAAQMLIAPPPLRRGVAGRAERVFDEVDRLLVFLARPVVVLFVRGPLLRPKPRDDLSDGVCAARRELQQRVRLDRPDGRALAPAPLL